MPKIYQSSRAVSADNRPKYTADPLCSPSSHIRHGPIRGNLVRQKGVPNTSHQAFFEPHLGREDAVPRQTTRGQLHHSIHSSRLGQGKSPSGFFELTSQVSGNDMVGSCTLPLSELIADAPKPDPATGLYGEKVDGKHEMKEFTVST